MSLSLVPSCALHLVLTSNTYPSPLRASQSERNGLGSGAICKGVFFRAHPKPKGSGATQSQPPRARASRRRGRAPPLTGPAPPAAAPSRHHGWLRGGSGRGRRRSLGPAESRGRHRAASRPLVEREARAVGSVVSRAGAGPRAGPRGRSRYRGGGRGAGFSPRRFPARKSGGSLIPA